MPDYGRNSAANSSYDALGATETFTGQWETNGYAGAYAAVSADQAGTLYIDVGIPTPGGIALVEEHAFSVLADEPIFRAVVKGSGMASRVRYINGADAQSEFWLKGGYGNNDVPNRLSEDGEVYTTVTERERNVHLLTRVLTTTTGTTWYGVIDLSDTVNWPHDRDGRIDFSILSRNIEKANATRGEVSIGVITRVDGTSADVTHFAAHSFAYNDSTGASPQINLAPTQVKCAVVDGQTPFIKSSLKDLAVTAINTGMQLQFDSTGEFFTPAVGDIVMKVDITSGGASSITFSGSYHAEPFPTAIG